MRITFAMIVALVLAIAWCHDGGIGAAYARGRPDPFVPNIIEVEKDHAWCYVLTNSNSLIDNLNIMSCVLKH